MTNKRKIVIASDSFKGSLTSWQVAEAAQRGVLNATDQYSIHKVAIADGGEGTTEALINSLDGKFVCITVNDPLLRPIKVRYGISGDGQTAIIELAAASGIALLRPEEMNPLETTTYGTGQMILDAYERGCRNFLIGIGGSATNDAAIGMLSALGFCFMDKNGKKIAYKGESLSQIVSIKLTKQAQQIIENSVFTVACDVTNPLFGRQGAAYIFAPQKGASPQMVEELDGGLRNFATVVQQFNGQQIQELPGAGAAGGVGGALKALLGARLMSGIEMVLDAVKFDELLKGCDLVITGEGRMDRQTISGKAPYGVLKRAQKYSVPVVAISGSVEDWILLNQHGFTAIFPIQAQPNTIEDAMKCETTAQNIERTVNQIINLIINLES